MNIRTAFFIVTMGWLAVAAFTLSLGAKAQDVTVIYPNGSMVSYPVSEYRVWGVPHGCNTAPWDAFYNPGGYLSLDNRFPACPVSMPPVVEPVPPVTPPVGDKGSPVSFGPPASSIAAKGSAGLVEYTGN